MAVKALFQIGEVAPESDGSFRFNLKIWSGANGGSPILNDEYFAPGALSTSINNSLHTFVEGYIQDEWEVEFNPLVDVVKCVNPVSLL